MTKARSKIVVVAASLVLGAAAVWFTRSSRRPASQATSQPRERSSQEAKASTPPRSTPAQAGYAGLRGHYALDYRLKMRDQTGAVTEFALAATLDVGEPKPGDDDIRVARLGDVRASASGPYSDNVAMKSAAYAAPWRLRYGLDGSLAAAEFSKDTPVMARATLQQIASLCQWVAAATPSAKTWLSTERDSNGPYVARYQRSSGEGDAQKVIKTFGARADVANSQDVVRSEGEVALWANSVAITAAEGKLSQHFNIARQPVEVTTQITLKHVGPQALASAGPVDTAWNEGAFVPFSNAQIPRQSQVDADRQRVAGRSFERIVSDIEKADQASNWQARKSFGFDLAALMRLDPTVVLLTVDAVGTNNSEPVRRTLIESLANAATPAGQKGLVQLLNRSSLPTPIANQARAVSGFVVRPIEELLDQLDKDSRSDDATVRRSSLFALGGLLGTRFDDGINDDRLKSFIKRGLAAVAPHGIVARDAVVTDANGIMEADGKPKPDRTAREWLQLLAATHAPEVLPVLATAVRHADHTVRADAVLAIRHIKGATPALLLSERAVKDPVYYVRHHAVTALADLGPEQGKDAVLKVLKKDAEPAVRAEAAFTLGRWSRIEPGLKANLQAALNDEESEVVINAILDATVPGRGAVGGPSKQVTLGGAK